MHLVVVVHRRKVLGHVTERSDQLVRSSKHFCAVRRIDVLGFRNQPLLCNIKILSWFMKMMMFVKEFHSKL